MPSFVRYWMCGLCLMALCAVTGCSKTEELEKAVRRAEKAEQNVASLLQVRDELMEKKKGLELQVLQLQQPHKMDVNDLIVNDTHPVVSDDPVTQEIEQLKQQLLQAQAEIKDKDKDIQELQDLVESLTNTVNQLQGGDVDVVVPEVNELQDANDSDTM